MEQPKKGPETSKDKPQKSAEREDHLAPTPVSQNTQEENKTAAPNFTHGELQNRLDLYGRLAKEPQQFYDIHIVREQYLKEVNRLQVNQAKEAVHYSQGIRSGLPHGSFETIKMNYERQELNLRNVTAQEAKEVYNSADNLRKDFAGSKPSLDEIQDAFMKAKHNQQPKSLNEINQETQIKAKDEGKDMGK